jgi:hypothetical protein
MQARVAGGATLPVLDLGAFRRVRAEADDLRPYLEMIGLPSRRRTASPSERGVAGACRGNIVPVIVPFVARRG